MSVLPGDSTDGTGRICTHFLIEDDKGPIVEPHVLHAMKNTNGEFIKGKLIARSTRMSLACDPNRDVAPVTRNGVTSVTSRSTEARAVNCPKCMKTVEYIKALALEDKGGA